MADQRLQILLTASDQTKAAFAAAGRSVAGMRDQVTSLATRFTGLGGAITGVLATIGAARGIALLDQLDDLAEKTGLSVEKLSELRYAGEAVGTPLETLTGSLGRLSKLMAEAASGNKSAAATFSSLGVEVKNADGSLRSSDEVLGDLADRFSKYRDGAGKAAQAQAIFGKSGAEMIPLLNQGRAGIEALRKEAQQLGAIYSGDMAKDAAAFNDTLGKLKIHAEAAAISIAGPLLKSLNRLLVNYLELKKLGGLDLVIGDAFKGLLGGGRLSDDPESDLHRLLAERRQLEEQLAKGSTKFFDRDKRLETEEWAESLQKVNTLLSYTQGRLDRARGESFSAKAALWGGGAGGGDDRPPMPGLGNANAADQADAMARKIMDRQIKDIRANAEERKQALDFGNTLAKAAYDDGRATLQAHHDAMAASRAAALQSELHALDEEAQTVRDYMAKVSKPTERADAETRLQEIAAKRAGAMTAASQAAVIAARDEGLAVAQLQQRYEDFLAQVAESRGDLRGAAAMRIGREVGDLQRMLRQAGKDTRAAAAYGERLTQQVELNQVQRDYQLLVERTAMVEERALLNARQRGDGELETLRAVGAARTGALVQMGEMVTKARQLADELGTPEAQAFADQLALGFRRALAEVDPLLNRLRELGQEAGAGIASSMADAALEFKGFSSLIKDVDKQLTRLLLNEFFTKPAASWLGNGLGDLFKAAGGAKSASITGDSATDALIGLAGKSGANSAWSSFGTWISGLMSFDVGTDYVPRDMIAKIHKGERIVRAADNKPGAMGGTINQTLNFNVQGSVDRRSQQQIAAQAYRAVLVANRRNN